MDANSKFYFFLIAILMVVNQSVVGQLYLSSETKSIIKNGDHDDVKDFVNKYIEGEDVYELISGKHENTGDTYYGFQGNNDDIFFSIFFTYSVDSNYPHSFTLATSTEEVSTSWLDFYNNERDWKQVHQGEGIKQFAQGNYGVEISTSGKYNRVSMFNRTRWGYARKNSDQVSLE
jgi:hypothetical protein